VLPSDLRLRGDADVLRRLFFNGGAFPSKISASVFLLLGTKILRQITV